MNKRIYQIAKELNIAHHDIVSFLENKGMKVTNHMMPVDNATYSSILMEFSKEKKIVERSQKEKARIAIESTKKTIPTPIEEKIDKSTIFKKEQSESASINKAPADKKELNSEKTVNPDKLTEKKSKEVSPKHNLKKVSLPNIGESLNKTNKIKGSSKKLNIADSLSKLNKKSKKKIKKKTTDEEVLADDGKDKIIKVPEFLTVDELSKMMKISAQEIIMQCMDLGLMVTINQRLDMDTITMVSGEFGYKVETLDIFKEDIVEEEVDESLLISRPPVVTVMGHVDHGKTSLLDFIRKSNIAKDESGGITQHIGAYSVKVNDSEKITFLDTPGHEAFTAMRARGAQITDIVIIIIAADDDIMPQTKEAISHAQAAGVPMIFAINKIDKENSNPDKVKESLASMNLLVEDWGGKIQSQDISAISGKGVDLLLEKIILESDVMDLKANPSKKATGTVLEAYLDKGRGYVSTILVQNGSLSVGDYILAGKNSGKVKAMFDESGEMLQIVTPSTPVSVLGLDGAPQAGDPFKVIEDEKEAKQIAAKRTQLVREQNVRTQKHLTLDEIGRRIAIGDFKEMNVIVKADVDGSVEALTDSFQNLSTEEIQVNIIFKGVGTITDSDVLLASASQAIIIGFNVRPTDSARKISEKEQVDIRSYSIIYDAINDLKDAMEGLLSPDMHEEIIGSAEVRDIFKISKLGTIAGCMVTSGKVTRNSGVRVIREENVIFDGKLSSLKRFKDDAKEVTKGFDCGLQIIDFNDVQVGDLIESYQEVAVRKKL